MGWNVKDTWPDPSKLATRRRVRKLQRQTKTVEQLAENRTKKIKLLRCRIAKLEQEDE